MADIEQPAPKFVQDIVAERLGEARKAHEITHEEFELVSEAIGTLERYNDYCKTIFDQQKYSSTIDVLMTMCGVADRLTRRLEHLQLLTKHAASL